MFRLSIFKAICAIIIFSISLRASDATKMRLSPFSAFSRPSPSRKGLACVIYRLKGGKRGEIDRFAGPGGYGFRTEGIDENNENSYDVDEEYEDIYGPEDSEVEVSFTESEAEIEVKVGEDEVAHKKKNRRRRKKGQAIIPPAFPKDYNDYRDWNSFKQGHVWRKSDEPDRTSQQENA
mmetsp:Transcript_8963/g.13406  ORF Transcript_8963/g.13406 Transcript_8963/m.13406 type:complete len:178 (+) Transcript_8963:81-614(+)